jgi:hypothetical protein
MTQAYPTPPRADRRRFMRMVRNGQINPTSATAAAIRHREARKAKREAGNERGDAAAPAIDS